jgi:hypothetical protein
MPYHGSAEMTDVIVERTVNAGIRDHDICLSDPALAGCLDIHRVEWRETFLRENRQRLICHFRAPDAETVRMLLRNAGVGCDALWVGTMHGSLETGRGNVVVEHTFRKQTPADTTEAIRVVIDERLAPLDLELCHAIVSQDRSHVLCLCDAPESLAQSRDDTWGCQHLVAPA